MQKPVIRAALIADAQRLLLENEALYVCDGCGVQSRAFGNTPAAAYSAWLESLALSGRLADAQQVTA